jgi:hypothetical protein
MAGWCSTTQLGYCENTADQTAYADLDQDGSADVNVKEWAITTAARWIWSIIQGRDDYGSTAAMGPEAYTGGSGTYPVLEAMNAHLAAAILRGDQGPSMDFLVALSDHWVVKWARDVRNGEADVVTT